MKEKLYYVYALIKDRKPIYVGCTCDVLKRVSQHKIKKEFSGYVIIEVFKSKAEALISERGIIKFISLQNNNENLNAKYDRFTDVTMYKNI